MAGEGGIGGCFSLDDWIGVIEVGGTRKSFPLCRSVSGGVALSHSLSHSLSQDVSRDLG